MGGKTGEKIFQKQTNRASKKCCEKNRHKKVRKNFFLIHKNIVTKKLGGGETCEAICPETQQKGRTKNVGKKIVAKNCKKKFFIFTRISCPKNGGKKRAKQFFQKHTNRES